MLKYIKSVPRNVFGILVSGMVDKEDFELLKPEIEDYKEKYRDLKILFVIDDGTLPDPRLLWENLLMEFEYTATLKKMAVITENRWLDKIHHSASHNLPEIKYKEFIPVDREKAVKWLRKAEIVQ